MKIRTDRLFAAVLSLIITLSITLVTIVAVMAANSQTLSGSMSVSYHANNVAATLRATYQVAGSNNATSLVNTTNNTDYLRFYATDATTTGELNGGNIYLTSSSPYVLFTFAFTNNATRDLENNVQGYDIRITLRDNSVRNNVTAKYMTDTTAPSGTLSSKYETMSEASTSLPSAVYVGAEQTVYFYLLLEITDLDYGAQYASYSNAGVSWSLDHINYKDGTRTDDFIVNQDNVLTGYNGSSTDIIIPDDVTSINANLFLNNTSITSVTIPSSVTRVGANSFRGCSNLESVTFEDGGSSTIIGECAFYGCSKLSSFVLSDSITSIGARAFYTSGISGAIIIPSCVTSIGEGAFSGWTGVSIISVDENNSVYYSQNNCIIRRSDKRLIQGCKNSVIPNDVSSIGNYAFSGCGPTSITIPNSVIRIGYCGFYGCKFTSITIPARVTSIDSLSFSSCSALTTITVDENNSTYYSQNNCIIRRSNKRLVIGCKNSVISNDVISIGAYAFYSCSLSSLTIPSGVTFIGYCAFQYCPSLKRVTFENPSGWWYASSETATSGTSISSSDLSNTTTAATYLKSTYTNYFWRCS